MRPSIRTPAIPGAALTALLLLVPAAVAQVVPRAAYIADGSFQLPPDNQPGGPDRPVALATAPGSQVHVVDQKGRVFVYDRGGVYRRVYGAPHLSKPEKLALARNRHAFVLDTDPARIVVFGPGGQLLRTLGRSGGRAGELDRPVDLALGPSEYLYVLDAGRKTVGIFSLDGTFVREIGLERAVHEPRAVAIGNDGSVYVTDARAPGHILVYPPFTELPWSSEAPRGVAVRLEIAGAAFDEPIAVEVNEFGTAVVLDRETGRLWSRNRNEEIRPGSDDRVYGGRGTGRGSFREPIDLARVGAAEFLILDARLRKVERIRLTDEVDRDVTLPDFDYPVRVRRVDLTIPAPLQAIGYRPDGRPLFLLDVRNRALSLLGAEPRTRETVYGDRVDSWIPDPGVFQQHLSEGLDDVGAAIVNDTLVVVTDPGRDRFAIYPLDTNRPAAAFGDNYRDDRRLHDPHGIAMLPDGRIVIADTGNDGVKVFSPDLASLVASLRFPGAYGIARAPDGDIFVWSRDGARLGRLPAGGGRIETLRPNLLSGPVADLTFDEAGNLFALDRETGRVTILGPGLDGILAQLGVEGELDRPGRIEVDRAGNIYLSDTDRGTTIIYRWDVRFPAASDLQVAYERRAATLRWEATQNRFLRHYQVQGAPEREGPYRVIGQTSESTHRLAVASIDGATPRWVRVAPFYVTGATGPATEPVPLFHFAARSAHERGEHEQALRDAERALELIEQDALSAASAVLEELLWIAFASSYALHDYPGAVRWGDRLATSPSAEHYVELFFNLAQAHLQLDDPRGASQRVLALVGGGPRPQFYRDSAVIRVTYRVWRELKQNGSIDEALAFLRSYVRAMPTTVSELRAEYRDSIAVYDTRATLAPGFQHWEDTNYAAVIRFFEGLLGTSGLNREQKVLSHQLLAVAYYAFGRRDDAAAAFREIYRIDPDFDLGAEIDRVRDLYGLTSLYNSDSRAFFDRLRPRS